MGTERIPDGEDVVEFLASLSGSGVAWVAGVGVVTDVALSVVDEAGEMPHALPGRLQLLSLSGPPNGPLMAIVAGTSGAVHGGRLLRCESAGVFAVLFDATVARAAGTARRAPRPPPADDDEADEAPRYGDRVDHFVFGLCDVMVVREERMKIRDVSRGGKLREIHLGAVKVLKPTTEDGRRVFKLARK
jgi:hypothetical protein